MKHRTYLIGITSLTILGFLGYYGLNNYLKLSRASVSDNVSGYAWSSNVGWISFNCANDNSCGQSDYGVNVNSSSGLMSGYAWSSNIGWISFDQSDLSGCPSGPPCEARVAGGLGGSYPKDVSGWAKVLSTNTWMSLRGSGYGVQLAVNGDFSDYSWESGVVGWVSWKGGDYGVRIEVPVYALSVSKTGNGSGMVVSSPAGISCGSDCFEEYEIDTTVTLSADPDPGSVFEGWSGSCSGRGNCEVTMNSPKLVGAEFSTISSLQKRIREILPF